ncbi:MAG TPA: hypothetical protein VE134_04740, partial [Methanomicrobiales archaeon]|nr:hypothetical protein [Methanomicrobiales archaeon]
MADRVYPKKWFSLTVFSGILILVAPLVELYIGVFSALWGWGGSVASANPLLFWGTNIWGIICGIIVLWAAYMLYTRPAGHTSWGMVIVLFSALSIIDGAGFWIGLVVGIITGGYTIMWSRGPPDVQIEPPWPT